MELLRLCRDGRVRMSEQVAKHGKSLIQNSKRNRQLSEEENWLVHEQVCYALLDTGDIDEAKEIVEKLSLRFPKSLRVFLLQGALCECCEDYGKAQEVYERILQENEAHQGAMKRQCCVAKAQGDTEKAIGMLKKYLDVFMTDVEAWEELASLYLSMQMTKQAAFCYEEAILIQPQNPTNHLKYADLLYVLSNASTLHLLHQAIGYYSVVLDLTNGTSVHAKYGVLSCCDAIKSQGRGASAKLTEDEEKLLSKVSRELTTSYEERSPQLAVHLKATGITTTT